MQVEELMQQKEDLQMLEVRSQSELPLTRHMASSTLSIELQAEHRSPAASLCTRFAFGRHLHSWVRMSNELHAICEYATPMHQHVATESSSVLRA